MAQTLLEKWRKSAYSEEQDSAKLQELWNDYFEKEKGIYQKILKKPDEVVTGTVAELAKKYKVTQLIMAGFLDGINDSLVNPNPIETMEADTVVTIEINKEALYKNMIAAGADWLWNLEEWNAIFDDEKRAALYKEQKTSMTVRKAAKVYPNDPCPCGSGKKYKKCCGKN